MTFQHGRVESTDHSFAPETFAEVNPRLRGGLTLVFAPGRWITGGTAGGGVTPTATVGSFPVERASVGPAVVVTASTASNGNRLQLAADQNVVFPNADRCTIAVYRRSKDTTARVSTLFGANSIDSDRTLAHAPYSDGNVYWDYGNPASFGRVSVAFTKSTDWEALVFVAGQTKGREIWRNGVRIASDAAATASRLRTYPNVPFNLGSPGTAGQGSDDEEVALLVVSPEEWTDGEVAAWSRDPFGTTFAPARNVRPVYSAAAGTPVGLSSETDTALALAAVAAKALGLSTEADSALALAGSSVRATGLAAESDAAVALLPRQILAAGRADEADTALELSPGAAAGAVGVSVESDTALALAARQMAPVGLAADASLAFALGAVSASIAGLSLEIDTSFALPAVQAMQAGRADEADESLALTIGGPMPVGEAVEHDEALALQPNSASSDVFGGGGGRILDEDEDRNDDAMIIEIITVLAAVGVLA